MPNYELHVGSAAFWRRASADIAAARRRVLIQAMTFEGDAAGRPVAAAIATSGAVDRRVLVDDYTRHVINDTFVALSRDPLIHAEAAATGAMFEELQFAGVGVRVTNPIDGSPLRYPLRNHKKLVVADDAVWLGGINFSDHNFLWHDAMVRIEGKPVADWLGARFEADWLGEPNRAEVKFGDELAILSFDGSGNPAGFAELLTMLRTARHRVELISAYPTFPFVDALAEAAGGGAEVAVYTPRPNNKPIVRDYLLKAARRERIGIGLLPEMTHVKAALIDGRTLVMGSCNFDFVSHRVSAEYVVVIRAPEMLLAAEQSLFGPARALAIKAEGSEGPAWRGLRARAALRCADMLMGRLASGRRVAEWSPPRARTRLAKGGGGG